MLVAGTPVFILPGSSTNIENPRFEGVHIEATTIDEMTDPDNIYTMKGTFTKATGAIQKNDYYLSTKGNLSRWTNDYVTDLKGTRAWLRPKDPSNAPVLVLGTLDDEATGIFNIEAEDLSINETTYAKGIYDLNGRKVSEGSFDGLPSGVYIQNGKKVVVK